MAPRVKHSMDFYKFCLIAFLILNNGFPITGVSEDHSQGSKSPSVKECRAHIEAALEQYWDTGEGGDKDRDSIPDSTPSSTTSQSTKSLERETEGPQTEDETDQDDDDTDPPVDIHAQDETHDVDDDDDEEEEDDNDEEDEEEEDDEDADEETQTPDDELDTADEDDEDNEDETADEDDEDETADEDDEDETADEETSPSAESDDGIDAKEAEEEEDEDDDEGDEEGDEEDEDEEGDDEEDEEEDQEEKVDTEKDTEKDSDEDEDDEDEDEDDVDENEEDEDEDEEDEDEEEPSDEILQPENSNKTVPGIERDKTVGSKDLSGKQEAEDEEEEDEEAEEDEEDVEEDDEEADEEEEEEEEDEEEAGKEEEEEDDDDDDEETEEEDQEDEDDEEEADVDEAEHSDQHKPAEDADKYSGSLQKDARGDKVTGETHSAPAGMAPELSETKPAYDQPKASPDEKKATLKSLPKEIEEEDEEEPEDVGEEHDDSIENIYEEEDEEDLVVKPGETLRSRDHVDAILRLDDIGTNYDLEEDKLAQSVFKDIKKIHSASIKPMEMLYKYADSTTRLLGDAEIFSKPMVLFLGPWSSGKTTVLNYLLGLERTPEALKTGTGITDLDFTVINYGEQRRLTSGTALAADWTYCGLQKFGQGLLDHFKGVTIPHTLLKKITLVDTPGIIESKKNDERGYPFNDAFQWFIDRADAIYVVLDPTKVDIGAELGSVLDQLKGREVRFILNKADTIRRSDLMRVVGQLFWNLSPLLSSTEAPVIYAVSLSTKPFQPSAPTKFLADQENNFLYDLRETIDKHVENRIRYARRHAVRVRNHCKMVDCYLSTYYRHKSIFSSKKNVAKLVTENPAEYNIYDGLSSMTNVSRYDLPDPIAYKSFFRTHPLYDFKLLVSTCSYFRGCPMDKLDLAISNELPELLAKYKKAKLAIPTSVKEEGR